MKHAIFFETFSVVQIIFLVRYIRSAKTIYFFKKIYPRTMRERIIPGMESIVTRLVRILNRNAEIRQVPQEFLLRNNWEMNKRAIPLMDELAVRIKETAIYKTVLKIIGDDNIIKFYQHELVNEIATRLLFFATAKHLRDLIVNGELLLVIPANNDNTVFQEELFGGDEMNEFIPKSAVRINRLRIVAMKNIFIIMFMTMPIVFILLRLPRLSTGRTEKMKHDLLLPTILGVYTEETITGGVKRSNSDEEFYDDRKIAGGKAIHLFDKWRKSADVENEYKRAMNAKGIPFADSKYFRMSFDFIRRTIVLHFLIIWEVLKNRMYLSDNYYYLYMLSAKMLKLYLDKSLELENLNYKVEIVRDDYNSGHIISTILCNCTNRKTLGIQHHINAYDFPQLCYVHLDKYIVFGDILVNTFKPHWDRLDLKKTGRHNIDWVVDIAKDHNKLSEIKDVIHNKYGLRSYNVLFTLPSGSSMNRKEQWDEVYNALIKLAETEIDFNLFLRFRRTDDLDGYAHIARFFKLPEIDNRFVIDHINFTTHELMVAADLVIANSASFSIFESVAIGEKVFSFNFIGVAEYYFSDYGKDFILNTSSDLIRVFKGLENNLKISIVNGRSCNRIVIIIMMVKITKE